MCARQKAITSSAVSGRAGAGLDRGVHALAPLGSGTPKTAASSHAGMTVQDVLDLGRVDVDAARDDHVALAVADVDEALVVHLGHVAHAQPVAARRLARWPPASCSTVEHARVPAHVELARLARSAAAAPSSSRIASSMSGRGPAARVRACAACPRAAARCSIAELGGAVELVEHGPEVGEHLLLHAHGAGGRRHHDGRAWRRRRSARGPRPAGPRCA